MEWVDKTVAKKLNDAHRKLQESRNAKKKGRTPYQVGEWVWLLRPTSVGGHKLQSWWKGPYQVMDRVG